MSLCEFCKHTHIQIEIRDKCFKITGIVISLNKIIFHCFMWTLFYVNFFSMNIKYFHHHGNISQCKKFSFEDNLYWKFLFSWSFVVRHVFFTALVVKKHHTKIFWHRGMIHTGIVLAMRVYTDPRMGQKLGSDRTAGNKRGTFSCWYIKRT